MCSLDTVFDLVCANHQASVPDQYYETLRLMDNTATDLDILSCSDIVRLYDRTAIQVHSKVDYWLNDNTVVTGAQSDHTDAPRPQGVWVAYTTVRRKKAAPAKEGCKWVLPEAPRPDHSGEDTEDEVLVVSSPDVPSTSSLRVGNWTQTPLRTRSFNAGINMEALDPHPEVTPDDELVKIWSLPQVQQGFWPEVRGCEEAGGCPCWRCFSGCKLKLPNHIMVSVWASEWQRIIVQEWYWEREKSCWDDNATMDREDDAYHEGDFDHLMIYDASAGTQVLTIHPEMGLTHQHIQVEYPEGGLTGEVRTLYTAYFMVLTSAEGEEEPEEEHAIEALRVTWGEDIVSQVHALVRNQKLRRKNNDKLRARPAYTSKKGHRVYRHKLLSEKVDSVPTAPDRTPRTPRPAAAARTVHRVRHKDVAHRVVVPVNETMTRDVLRMLNMHGLSKIWDIYDRRYDVYTLTKLDPEPHIGDGTSIGDQWARNHLMRGEDAMPSVSTQTPRPQEEGYPPRNPSYGKRPRKHLATLSRVVHQHKLKRGLKSKREKHEVRLLRHGITISPATRKYSGQVARHQAEQEANRERPMSPPWAPPPPEDVPIGGCSQRCSTCEHPGHRSSECAALQASRIMRDSGPYLPLIGTEHITKLYTEPTTPLWDLTVTRRNVVTITEIDDPPRISTDPSTPQWAPVTSKPSISLVRNRDRWPQTQS